MRWRDHTTSTTVSSQWLLLLRLDSIAVFCPEPWFLPSPFSFSFSRFRCQSDSVRQAIPPAATKCFSEGGCNKRDQPSDLALWDWRRLLRSSDALIQPRGRRAIQPLWTRMPMTTNREAKITAIAMTTTKPGRLVTCFTSYRQDECGLRRMWYGVVCSGLQNANRHHNDNTECTDSSLR